MRFTLLGFACFGLNILNLKDAQVCGAITLLSDARRQDYEEENDKENTQEISQSGEREPGFKLNDKHTRKFHLWPNGIIPYYIDDFSFDKVLRDTIRSYLKAMNYMTNLQFVEQPRPPMDDSRWVFFINRQGLLGCADYSFGSFTNEGVQKIVLGYDCINNDYGLNEVLLMLVGIPPQHNAPTRDKFIQVNMNNVMSSKKYLFKKLNDDEWLFHDLEYDYSSAGHYDSHKFTKNGGATIIPKDGNSIVQTENKKKLSHIDIKKIRMLYNFISEKKSRLRLKECNKMFSRGSNFTKYNKNTESKKKPRRKPNKYLGLPDEASEKEEENESHSKTHSKEVSSERNENITSPQTAIDTSDNEGELNNVSEKDEIENKENKDSENKSTLDSSIKENDESQQSEEELDDQGSEEVKGSKISADKSVTLRAKKKEKSQNLLDLSDFATGEN